MSAPRLKEGDVVRVIENKFRPDLILGSERVVAEVGSSCVKLVGHDPENVWTSFNRVEKVPPSIKSDTQLGKVLALTLGQGSWTLAGIASVTGASEAAVSARLRDLRAAGYEVTCTKLPGDAQRNYTVRRLPIAVASDGTATLQTR